MQVASPADSHRSQTQSLGKKICLSHHRDRRRAVRLAIGILPANDHAVSLPAIRGFIVRNWMLMRVRRARVAFHADRCPLSFSPSKWQGKIACQGGQLEVTGGISGEPANSRRPRASLSVQSAPPPLPETYSLAPARVACQFSCHRTDCCDSRIKVRDRE